jgi:hypothetical protein
MALLLCGVEHAIPPPVNTPHMAPHWVRRATTVLEVEAFALEVLEVGQQAWAPSDGWTEAA